MYSGMYSRALGRNADLWEEAKALGVEESEYQTLIGS
jgi:hypothetical protein